MSYESVKKGRIVGFRGSWGSGIAQLLIETENGPKSIPCDNAPTVRALDAAFGGVIDKGHTANTESIKGRPIAYVMDDMDLVLGGFVPISDFCLECGPFREGCDTCEDKEP